MRINLLDFPEASLGDIVSYLQDSAKVPIRLDEKALEESGLPPDTMCKLMMHGCRLDDALQTLCENFPGTRLGYYVDRGVLQITAFERMESTSRLRFYDLSGEIKNLASAVSQYAERMGSPPDVISHLGDSLAIRASLSTHAEIEEFIAGTPAHVAERIVEQCRRIGAGHFLAVLHWGAELDEVAAAHELFGREVIPALRKAEL